MVSVISSGGLASEGRKVVKPGKLDIVRETPL